MQIPSCFLWVLDHSPWVLGPDHTSSYYRHLKKISVLLPVSTIWSSKPLSTYTKPQSHSQTSCSLHTKTWLITAQFLTQLLTYTYIHPNRNTPTVASLFFSLPLTTPQNGSWWYWQHGGTAPQALKINTRPTTAQHTNVLPVKLVISESQFTLLMEVCFDPIINFSMIYATIWYFLSVNSQLIFIPSVPMD